MILNPASAAGRTGRNREGILEAIERGIGSSFTLYETRRALDATEAARAAVLAGADLIVAVGGDGTIQEVVNGMLESGRPLRTGCELGIIRAGTGCGFADSFGLPPGLAAQCAALGNGTARSVDVGLASFSRPARKPGKRYFINECQAGLGGEVVKRVRSGNKKLGGLLVFGLKTLAVSLTYPNRRMDVALDGGAAVSGPFLGIIAANGNSMAGGMRLAPAARIDDGLLDVLLMHGQSVRGRLADFPKIYSGRHIGSPDFTCVRARVVEIGSDEDVSFEADGELLGGLPVRVEVLPGALRVRSASPAKG